MASFKDRIPQFRDYVQQLPVEVMAEVGQYKQQKYDLGVQRIQSSIDQLGSINVLKDSHKAYLQSKINEVGNTLRGNIAADYSETQLVNSAVGVVSNVVKDPIISNAVESSMKYKKQADLMEEDRKKGTLTPDNEAFFNKQVQSWFDDPDLKSTFNGKYVPFFDVNKFAKETIDNLKPDSYSFDQIFQTDAAGNPIVGRNGVYKLSTTMTRLEKEGLFPPKVKEAVDQIFSDARVNQQLNITGQYNYRGVDSESLVNRITSQKDQQISNYQDNLFELNIKKSLGEDVQDQIDNVTDNIEKTAHSYDSYIQQAKDNPDAVRGSIYKDETRARFNKMFTWSKTKESKHENPAWKAEFDMNKEATRRAEWNWEAKFKVEQERNKNALEEKKFNLDVLKTKIEQQKADAAGKKTTTPGPSEASPIFVPQDTDTANQMVAVIGEQKYNDAATDWASSRDKFLWSVLFNNSENNQKAEKIVNEAIANGKQMTLDQAQSIILSNTAKQSGMSPEVFRTNYFTKARNIYNKTKANGKIDPVMQDNFQAASAAYSNFTRQKNNKQAIDRVGALAMEDTEIGKEISNIKPEKVSYRGQDYILTAQDQIDIATLVAHGGTITGPFNSNTETASIKAARNRLKQRGLTDLSERIVQFDNVGFLPIKSVEEVFSDARDIYSYATTGKASNLLDDFYTKTLKLSSKIKDKSYSKVIAAKAAKTKEIYNVNPNVAYGLTTGDLETDRGLVAKLDKFLYAFQANGDEQYLGDKEEFDTFVNTVGKDNVNYVIEGTTNVNGQASWAVVAKKDGKVSGKMVLNPDMSKELGYDESVLFESSGVTALKEILNTRGNQTSFSPPSDKSTYYNGDYVYDDDAGHFPGVTNKQYSLKANIVKANDKYYPYLYISNGKTDKIVPYKGYPDLEKLNNALIQLDDNFIANELKK